VAVALDEGIRGEARGVEGDRIAAALAPPHPGALGADRPAQTAAVPAAFVAVREHGARLAHAMSQHRLQDEAEAKASMWNVTFGIPFTAAEMVPGWGIPAVAAETVVTDVIGTDGSWHNTPDLQRHHSALEAIAAGDAAGGPVDESLRAYAGTLQALGPPEVPRAPSADLGEKVAHAVGTEVLGGWVGRGLRLRDPFDGIVGGAVVEGVEDLVPGSVDGGPQG
jgi:hypothetical protein